MGLHAGRLRHVIEIQECIQVQNVSSGGMVDRWQTVTGCSAVPAEIVYISGREFISSNAKQSEIVARITIRKRTGITTKMRIIGMGKTFDIQGILPDHETGNTWLTMPVSEVLNSTVENLVVFSTTLGNATILTDYTCSVDASGGFIFTQTEFNYLAIKQDCTTVLSTFKLGDQLSLAFSDYPVTVALGVTVLTNSSHDVVRVGNVRTTDYTVYNCNLSQTAQYSVAVDASVGTYGAVYFYENGVLLTSHILTAALAGTPDRFTIYGYSTVPGNSLFSLIDVRAYDVSGSTAWNRY